MEWLNIEGYDGEYQLSDKGILRRTPKGKLTRVIKPCKASNGDLYVTLWRNGKRKNYMLHNLYAETFCMSVEKAKRILYEGYDGADKAKDNVRKMLVEKIHECEANQLPGETMNDEILYLRSFLRQVEQS